MPRCGSLDSLRDGPHVPHDDGKFGLAGGGAGLSGASGTKYIPCDVVCIQNRQDGVTGMMVQ